MSSVPWKYFGTRTCSFLPKLEQNCFHSQHYSSNNNITVQVVSQGAAQLYKLKIAFHILSSHFIWTNHNLASSDWSGASFFLTAEFDQTITSNSFPSYQNFHWNRLQCLVKLCQNAVKKSCFVLEYLKMDWVCTLHNVHVLQPEIYVRVQCTSSIEYGEGRIFIFIRKAEYVYTYTAPWIWWGAEFDQDSIRTHDHGSNIYIKQLTNKAFKPASRTSSFPSYTSSIEANILILVLVMYPFDVGEMNVFV